jgi:hypothetical protein
VLISRFLCEDVTEVATVRQAGVMTSYGERKQIAAVLVSQCRACASMFNALAFGWRLARPCFSAFFQIALELWIELAKIVEDACPIAKLSCSKLGCRLLRKLRRAAQVGS